MKPNRYVSANTEPIVALTNSNVHLMIQTRTIVKVVVVGAVAAYFARSLVSVIDENLGRLNKKVEETNAKMQQDNTSK